MLRGFFALRRIERGRTERCALRTAPCARLYCEDIKLGSDPRASLEADDKCRECPFLPECTPFCKHGCPDWFEYCREFKCVDTDEQIKRLSI